MFSEINSSSEFEKSISHEPAMLVYFSNDRCGVCKSLKPKIEHLVGQHFPKMKLANIKAEYMPELCGQYRVFAIPSVLVFFYNKETIRKIRNFSINELIEEIERPYSLIFEK